MELAWICAQQVAVLFLLIGAGALGVKMGWLKAEGRQMLSSLLVNLVVPAMIVNSYRMEFSSSVGILTSMPLAVRMLRLSIRRMRAGVTVTGAAASSSTSLFST